ncbi:flagellar type III secretion system pore protein FliP [Paenibacillus ginsengarvi]|uniref:Flagellar biosynthetic protein FliP n=1 Tax=Paenibacillus ginsengarvi TaxID=400777 RepID=A0A3B0CTU2_9BACL|nr:flagellar type III secretion system pore protein FliP [Paenibacillus ginsengarvi]RKN86509.1 flagellar biosynthetic protein FliP [Paenibacillus ginsengarvi]
MKRYIAVLGALLAIWLMNPGQAFAADPIPGIDINVGSGEGIAGTTNTVTLILLITVLSLAPAILVLMTSFTRIVIVLGFVRTALGTQQMPPNQVLIGLALFLSLFVMSPTISQMNQTAIQPYLKGEITQTDALAKAALPLKKFMAAQTREKDLMLFLNYSKAEKPKGIEDTPLTALIPAFAISELKSAFQMGFMIFIPFLVIDMVVASTLMAMGMMMLPPVMISLPFKILLFVLVDGWYLVVKSLLLSFNAPL